LAQEKLPVKAEPPATAQSEPKALENEEWAEFLDGTMEDAIENPQTLNSPNLVAMVVAPLRNVNASPALVERIATLLAIPWANIDQQRNSEAEETLIRTYSDTRVVPNLLYAAKVMVQRRSAPNTSQGTADGKGSGSELTADDLQALEMLFGLICRLVHLTSTSSLMHQFCDAVCVLDSSEAINRLLTVDKRKARVVSHILAVLSHTLRICPDNVSVVQDILTPVDLMRLLSSRNPLIRSRCCTLIGYLTLR
jgi:hypothetical protein